MLSDICIIDIQTPESMSSESRGNLGSKIGLIILIAATALLGYLYFSSQSKNKHLKALLDGKVIELSDTKVKLDSIARELEAKILEAESLGADITELQNIKVELERDISSLKSSANFSVKQYNDKIADYERRLTVKENELTKLKEEFGLLESENLTLKTEKEEIEAEVVVLSEEKDQLTSKVEEVEVENEELLAKVQLASALKAGNVSVLGLTSKGKERDGKLKNRRIDQLKISFILLDNPVAEDGRRDVFLRILDPNGAVLNDMSKGGVININNKEIGYTLKDGINYTNSNQTVEMFYKKEQSFISGVYKVELYAEGFKIGSGNFQVK